MYGLIQNLLTSIPPCPIDCAYVSEELWTSRPDDLIAFLPVLARMFKYTGLYARTGQKSARWAGIKTLSVSTFYWARLSYNRTLIPSILACLNISVFLL